MRRERVLFFPSSFPPFFSSSLFSLVSLSHSSTALVALPPPPFIPAPFAPLGFRFQPCPSAPSHGSTPFLKFLDLSFSNSICLTHSSTTPSYFWASPLSTATNHDIIRPTRAYEWNSLADACTTHLDA